MHVYGCLVGHVVMKNADSRPCKLLAWHCALGLRRADCVHPARLDLLSSCSANVLDVLRASTTNLFVW